MKRYVQATFLVRDDIEYDTLIAFLEWAVENEKCYEYETYEEGKEFNSVMKENNYE